MFAVLKLSGSQYKVTVGDVLTVNKVPEAEVGKSLHIDDVLLVGTSNQTIVGAPLVPNARVEVEEQKKVKKVIECLKRKEGRGTCTPTKCTAAHYRVVGGEHRLLKK